MRRLERIGSLRLGRILTCPSRITGLIAVSIFLLMAVATANLRAHQSCISAMFEVDVAIAAPLFYGATARSAAAFNVNAAIGAALYTPVARRFGGIEVKVESARTAT